jgi:crotonobetaine/carnitine-CoA ligase
MVLQTDMLARRRAEEAVGSSAWMASLELTTVRQLVSARAQQYGSKVLLHIGDDRVTYAEAHERSNALANGLAARGFVAGDRIASFRHNCIDDLVLWFACAKLGVLWVPLNASLVQRDLTYTLNDCGARMLIVDSAGLESYLAVRDQVDAIEYEVVPDDSAAGPAHGTRLTELFSSDRSDPAAGVGPGTPCTVTYTGGSTGMPKGAVIPNFAYIASGMRYQEATEATDSDVMVALGHLFHVGGQQVGLIGPMFCGMTTVMTPWFSASGYWDLVRRHEATIIDPFGSVVIPLLRQPPSERDRQHRVRTTVGTGTGGLPRGTRDEFEQRFGVEFNEVYAQTELGAMLVNWRPWDRPPNSCGTAHGWAQLTILNEDDEELPPGVVGEIGLRPRVPFTFMLGYLNKPEMTAATWRNLWHHTGDYGYLDADGNLYFEGRAAHWMRVRGENVSAIEVESVIMDLDTVAEVAVVGVPSDRGEDDIKAYVIPVAPEHEFDPATVIDVCEGALAYFKVPRYVELVTDFPRTLVKQEIMRHELKARGVGASWDAAAHGRHARRKTGRS